MCKQSEILKDVRKKQRGTAIISRMKKKNTGAQNCDYFNIFLSAEAAISCFISTSINQEENGENILPPAIFPI
jgi:hypothetical protein